MDWIYVLPHVNVTLNSIATVLLVTGFILIKQKKERAHKIVMISCFAVSALFLTCYLLYRFNVPDKKFPGDTFPTAKWFYYAVLIPHVALAVLVPFLAVTSIVLGLRNQRTAHKKLVRWTFPIWLFVSITGVIVYLMLFIIFVPAQ